MATKKEEGLKLTLNPIKWRVATFEIQGTDGDGCDICRRVRGKEKTASGYLSQVGINASKDYMLQFMWLCMGKIIFWPKFILHSHHSLFPYPSHFFINLIVVPDKHRDSYKLHQCSQMFSHNYLCFILCYYLFSALSIMKEEHSRPKAA